MVFKKIIALPILAALTAGSLSACTPKTDDLTQINVACFPNLTHAQALVMKDQGSLEKAYGDGVKVNWVTFNAGPEEIEALFAGSVDIGYIGPVPAVSGYIQSSGDLQIIAGAANGGAELLARADSGITSAADLAGKTVAIPSFGNTQHLSLLAMLSANGLAPTTSGGTVNVVPASNADVANLMDQKNIDAALVPEPWGTILENGGANVVLDYDQVDPNGIPATTVVIVRKDFLDAHPDAVQKFIDAHKAATDYINANPADAMAAVNNQLNLLTGKPIDTAVLSKAFSRMQIVSDIPTQSVMSFAQTSLDQQLIAKMPDDNLINDKYVK